MGMTGAEQRWEKLAALMPLRASAHSPSPSRRWWCAGLVSLAVHATTAAALVAVSQRVTTRPWRASFAGNSRLVAIEIQASMSASASAAVPIRTASITDVVVRPQEVQIARQRYRLAESQMAVDRDAAPDNEEPVTLALPKQAQVVDRPEEVAKLPVTMDRQLLDRQPAVNSTAARAARSSRQVAPGSSDRVPPKFISNRPPRYPETARQRGWQGTVYLRLTIDEEGRVTEVRVDRSSGYAVLDAEAVHAVRQWHAEPARDQGVPVASEELLPVRFEL